MSSALAMGKRSLTWSVVVATIAWSMGLSLLAVPLAARAQAGLTAGTLIKASLPAVYYYGSDGKRYVFPNERTYKTWYADFAGVQTVSDATLASIAIGGNATYRPGVKMVKITTDPKVYAVDRGGSLRHVATEAVATALYGASWASMVDDVPDAFFVNYTLGSAVNAATDFSVASTTTAATSISVDKGLAGGTTAPAAPAGPTVVTAADGGSPANATIPYLATDVIFAKLKLSGTGTLSGLKVTRTGLARDADLTAIKLYDGTTQIGTSQTLNAAHQASFTGLSIAISGDKVLSVAGDISNVNAGDIVQLGVEAAGDITLASGSAGGTFPIRGGQMTISAVTIGAATLFRGADMPTTDSQITPDQANFRFTQVRIQAGSAEDLTVRQIVAIQAGTATTADVKDITLVNDTAGAEIAKVATMPGNGRVVFDNLNVPVKKGESVNLSVKATMSGGSSSGRTVAFELHDGVAYTIRIVGNTFGFGITPAANDFCATAGVGNGVCRTQTVSQGTLRLTRAASSPATGNVAQGAVQVPLIAVDYTVSGEDARITSQNWDFAFGTMVCTELTSVTLYDKNGSVVAGPQDCSGGSVTFTDSMSVPVGTSTYTMKGNIASTTSAADTVTATLDVDQFTVRGVQSGKTTTVQTTTDIGGNTLTVQAGALTITNQATPIVGNVVRNTKNFTFLKTTLDASSGGEDAKVTSVVATNTTGTTAPPGDLVNWELWGDPDTSDATDVVQRLETTNSTAAGTAVDGTDANTTAALTDAGDDATVTFTLKTPLRVSKSKSSTLQVRADVISTAIAAGVHTVSIATAAGITTSGWTTGTTITAGTPSGAGQAQTVRASGSLKVELASDRPSAGPIVAGLTGVSTMKYKLTAVDENIDLTELPLAYTGNVANAARVRLFKDGNQIGATSGATFNADGFIRVVLDSGTLVLTKDTSTYIELKLDFNPKEQHVSGVTFRVGLGDSAGTTATLASSEWAAAGSYNVTATGRDSGTSISNANSTGAAGGTVDGGNTFASFDGVLSVGLDAGAPSGTQTPSAGKEVMRFWLTATGDEVTVFDIAFTPSGTAAAVTQAGAIELRGDSAAGNFQTLYADWADSSASAGAAAAHSTFHVNNGVSTTRSASTDGTEGWDQLLTISAGSTKVLRLTMDTSSLTTASRSYQVSVLSATAIDAGIDSGISWADGELNGLNGLTCPNGSEANTVALAAASFGATSECTIDSTVYTKTLPLNGGALTY